MSFRRRNQDFVDRPVQSLLVSRAIGQWFCCLVAIGAMLLFWRVATTDTGSLASHAAAIATELAPAYLAAVLLLPMAVIDVVRTSNRFVGPALRLRNDLRRLAAGEEVKPIRFRDNDMWQDMATEFNALLARLDSEKSAGELADATDESAEAPSSSSESSSYRAEQQALSQAAGLAREVSASMSNSGAESKTSESYDSLSESSGELS